jgi:hypothetical protein
MRDRHASHAYRRLPDMHGSPIFKPDCGGEIFVARWIAPGFPSLSPLALRVERHTVRRPNGKRPPILLPRRAFSFLRFTCP